MRRYAILAVVLALMMMPSLVLAYGTGAGSVITNKTLQINFTNVGGTKYSNELVAPFPVTTVRTGYDMSVISSPAKQYGSAGTSLTYGLGAVTNHGNLSTTISVEVRTNLYSNVNWLPTTFTILTNGAIAASAVNVATYNRTVAAEGYFTLSVRIAINGLVPNDATNYFSVVVNDGSAGDVWPTALASEYGYSADLANTRDTQTRYLTAAVQGPVMSVTKSVDKSLEKPFGVLTYTIKYTNSGSASALGVNVVDYIPNNASVSQNSAENFNTLHAGAAVIQYYDGATWQAAAFDDVLAQRLTVSRVRWTLDTAVGANQGGTLRFKVIIR